MTMVLFGLALFGWFLELSSQFILIILMIYTWIMEFFIAKMNYQIYTGDVSEELCSICLDDFSKTIPVVLPVCSGRDGPGHFFHEECISKHSEYFDHCPVCRKMYKASRYFRLGGINTNRYDMNRFNDHLRNFEYR